MNVELDLLTNEQIYQRVMREEIPSARVSLVVVTALIKQTRIESTDGIVPYCEMLDRLVRRGVKVCTLFAGKPSKPFMDSLAKFPQLLSLAAWRLCPRTHLKAVIVDGKRLYLGSANLTGAGLGMKGKSKRNFETGILTKDPRLVSAVAAEVGEIAGGKRCADCAAKPFCQREHQAFREALRVACQQP